MNFMKRAILHLTRKKGRTLLLSIYLVTMAVLILISFSFKNAAEKELTRLLQTFGTGFVLKIDAENPANQSKIYWLMLARTGSLAKIFVQVHWK